MTALPLTTGVVRPVSSDERRSITETVFETGGGVCRVGTITVTAASDVRLGDHYHPGDELFIIENGFASLYLANADTPERVTAQELRAGQTVRIPAGVVHTFVCAPGTVLKSIAHMPFDDKWIVGCTLLIATNL